MLGELITEERGKVTGRRVLDSQAGKMETSFTAMGKVKGVARWKEKEKECS